MKYPTVLINRGFFQEVSGFSPIRITAYYRALQVVCYHMLHAIAYGPLIKSGRRPMIRTARCCEGFPVYR
jgi:hypothetical protein